MSSRDPSQWDLLIEFVVLPCYVHTVAAGAFAELVEAGFGRRVVTPTVVAGAVLAVSTILTVNHNVPPSGIF